MTLARDAQSSGDRVAAENYLQHAEHYYRIVAAAQAQLPQPQPVYRVDDEADDEADDREEREEQGYAPTERVTTERGPAERQFVPREAEQPAYGSSDPQPYVNSFNGHSGLERTLERGPRSPTPPSPGSGSEGREGEEGETGQQPSYRMRRRRPNRGRPRREDDGGPQATEAAVEE